MSPADFEACVSAKGKMVTKSLKGGKYVHGCKDSKGWHWGEVKQTSAKKFVEGK